MLIKSVKSIPFYEEVLGMTLIDRFDFLEMAFSLYFLGYVVGEIPSEPKARAKWLFEQPALLELATIMARKTILTFLITAATRTSGVWAHRY